MKIGIFGFDVSTTERLRKYAKSFSHYLLKVVVVTGRSSKPEIKVTSIHVSEKARRTLELMCMEALQNNAIRCRRARYVTSCEFTVKKKNNAGEKFVRLSA